MRMKYIEAFANAAPWSPFEIVLDNGERISVRHPENIRIPLKDLIIVVENGNVRFLGPTAVSLISPLPRKRRAPE